MERPDDLALLEKFAVARLKYTVNELQTRVDHDRRSAPPVRKVFICVTDDTALCESITEFKKWVANGAVEMRVPLCALDALDQLKKGTESRNVNSRESTRYFDRVQSAASANRKPVSGVRLQSPSEAFPTWSECERFLNPDIPPPSSAPVPFSHDGYTNGTATTTTTNNNTTNSANHSGVRRPRAMTSIINGQPPKWIQQIINYSLYAMHGPEKQGEDLVLVSNHSEVTAWAKCFDIRVVCTDEIERMVERESWDFQERKRQFETISSPTTSSSNTTTTTTTSPGRGGSGRSPGRSGRPHGGSRQSFSGDFGSPGVSSGRGGNHHHHQQQHSPPGFVLRGAPRGVPRGRGKLWEP